MLQLTRCGAVLSSPFEPKSLRLEFKQRHCIRLRKLLEPGLLRAVQQLVAAAEFAPRSHEVGSELCMRENLASHILHLVTNDFRFREILRSITGCQPIGCFQGRVYRVLPNSGQQFSWHSDLADPHRMVGMSVNLSPKKFQGGVFELRRKRSHQLLARVANTGPGDAIVFRLAPYLEHRVTATAGKIPRTAFAGWFRTEPQFLNLLS